TLVARLVSLRAAPRQARVWWWSKDKGSTLHQGDRGTGNAPQLWPLGERRTSGPHSISSGTHCRRSPVEQARKKGGRVFLASGGLLSRARGLRFEAPSTCF